MRATTANLLSFSLMCWPRGMLRRLRSRRSGRAVRASTKLHFESLVEFKSEAVERGEDRG